MFSFGIRNVRIPLKEAGSPSPWNSNDPQGETSGFLKPVFLLRLVFDHIAELRDFIPEPVSYTHLTLPTT